MAGKIFINYRRGDDSGFVQALLGRLEQAFSTDHLFIDIDSIEPGVDFVRVLEEQVAKCDILLAVIGKGWVDARDELNARRLENPEDFVRIEIASALAQGKRVIPVLVGDARMPRSDELPEVIKPLVKRGAVRLTHERFRSDTLGLVGALQKALAKAQEDRETHEAARDSPTKDLEKTTQRDDARYQPLSAHPMSSRYRYVGLFIIFAAILLLSIGLPWWFPLNINAGRLDNPVNRTIANEVATATPPANNTSTNAGKPQSTIPSTSATGEPATTISPAANAGKPNSSLPSTSRTTRSSISFSGDIPAISPQFGIKPPEAERLYPYEERAVTANTPYLTVLSLTSERLGTKLYFDGQKGMGLTLIKWEAPSTNHVLGAHIGDHIGTVESRLGIANLRLNIGAQNYAEIYRRGDSLYRFDFDGSNTLRVIWKTMDSERIGSADPSAGRN
jgi:TIR domain